MILNMKAQKKNLETRKVTNKTQNMYHEQEDMLAHRTTVDIRGSWQQVSM